VPDDTPGGSTVRQGVKDQNSQAIDDLFVNLNSHSNNEDGKSHEEIDASLTDIETNYIPTMDALLGQAQQSEANAAASAGTATTQAGIATTQAEIATTQAEIAKDEADRAEATSVKSIINFLTIDDAINSSELKTTQACNIKERKAGDGGTAMADVVLASTVTIDGFKYIQCIGVPTLALVIRETLNGYINITAWGAKDDFSGALQAAFNYSNGSIPITADSGIYIADSQVNMFTSTDSVNIYQAANSFVGPGKEKMTIVNRTGTNWLIHKPSMAQAATGVRMLGFKLDGYTLITDGSSPAGSEGPLIYSAWQGQANDFESTGQKGDGFKIPRDDALNANVDRYSCGNFRMISTRLQSNDGIGLNAENPSLTLQLDDYYIVGNRQGGLFLTGASHGVNKGAIAGNGIDSGASGFGLHLAHSTGFTQHNVTIDGAEIDNNYGRDIIVDGYNNDIKCRIIQNGLTGFKATDMIFFNSAVSGGARCNRADIRVRIDSAEGNAINVVTTTDTAGTEDNTVNMVYGVTGDDSSVVKANLLGTTRNRNVVIEGLRVIGASHKGALHTLNKAFLTPSNSLSLNATPQILKFGTSWDDYDLWSVATWEFTAPHRGLCTVNFNCPFRAIIVNDPVTIYIKVNGVTQQEVDFGDGVTTTTGKQNLSFVATVAVDSGDTVSIFGSSASTNGAFFISDTDTTTAIFME
jgi:hypothetical protein